MIFGHKVTHLLLKRMVFQKKIPNFVFSYGFCHLFT